MHPLFSTLARDLKAGDAIMFRFSNWRSAVRAQVSHRVVIRDNKTGDVIDGGWVVYRSNRSGRSIPTTIPDKTELPVFHKLDEI